jgi:ribosomal protein S18 acetylase RimI-like enzyme
LWLICRQSEAGPIGYIILTVGFSFEFGGHDAFIDELYVSPEHRRKGVGRTAIKFLEARAVQMGVRAVHLEVSRDNPAAIELYSRCGYASHDRHLMTKRLAG